MKTWVYRLTTVVVVATILGLVAAGGFLLVEWISGGLSALVAKWFGGCNPIEQALGACGTQPVPDEYKSCTEWLSDEGLADETTEFIPQISCPILQYGGTPCAQLVADVGDCTAEDLAGVFCDSSLPRVIDPSDWEDDPDAVACIDAAAQTDGGTPNGVYTRDFCSRGAPNVDGVAGLSGPCGALWTKLCSAHCAGGAYSAPPAPVA